MNVIAKLYIRLVESGRRTVDGIPAEIVDIVRELAPELFKEAK